MTATLELSLYPLHAEYPSSVIDFLRKLKELPDVEIQSNGMSTVVIGDFGQFWPELGELIGAQIFSEDSVFVLKIASGRREYIDSAV
jgi:hypothetical protein